MDCFFAEPVIGPAEGRTRWLLAMTSSERLRALMPVPTIYYIRHGETEWNDLFDSLA